MESIVYDIGQYALKQEVSNLIATEIDFANEFRNTSQVNALGETSKQRFDLLLMESREEGKQFSNSAKNVKELDGLYQEQKYWQNDPSSPQGILHDQYKSPYIVSTQKTNVLPKTTLTEHNFYDSLYTHNRSTYTTPKLTGSESYIHESRWNSYKGVQVQSTVLDNKTTGDTILRAMGIQGPIPIETSGFSINNIESSPAKLEDTTVNTEYTTETAREQLAQQSDPMSIIAIQLKIYTMNIGAGITNSTIKSTEENLDSLSKAE